MTQKIKISKICDHFNLKYFGYDVEIDRLGLCNRKTEYSSVLSYSTSDNYTSDVEWNSSITCLIISEKYVKAYSEKVLGRKISFIISDEPEIMFYLIHEWLSKNNLLYEKYSFPPKIGIDTNISETAIIENGVIIGNRVSIGHNTVIKTGTIIDDDVTIGCNTTIGSEGFQLITDGLKCPMHITHVGKCHISSNVYIGDNSCVCNSLFEGENFIGNGVKIDNLVHVAHNLYIEKNAVIAAHSILCGSSYIEEGAWIAPNVSIINRVVVGKYSKVGLGSVVTKDVPPYTVVYGNPAREHFKKENNDGK